MVRVKKLRSGEASYHRKPAAANTVDPEPFGGKHSVSWPPLRNVSIDIGPVNMAITSQTLYVRADAAEDGTVDPADWVVPMEDAITLNCKGIGAERDESVEGIIARLFQGMNDPDNDWIWERDGEIVVERQVDQLQRNRTGHRKFQSPINFGMYTAIEAIVLARARAVTLLDYSNTGITITARGYEQGMREYVFTPASGSQKTGLENDRGRERKETTGAVAQEYFVGEKQVSANAFMESLLKPKPYEDVADAYLQGRRRLEDLHRERLKERRKEIRAARAEQNRVKKRKRSEAHAKEKAERAAKRAKTSASNVVDLTS